MNRRLRLLGAMMIAVAASVHAAMIDAWPQMVRADQAAVINLVFDKEPLLAAPARLSLRYLNDDGLRADGKPYVYGEWEEIPFTVDGNTVKAQVMFRGETSHALKLIDKTDEARPPIAVFKLYSLKTDYFALRPYKGNVHMHSQYSDGKEKTGSIMVATCRKFGQDFACESDHNKYEGSQEAMAFFKDLPTDMVTYPGEEVHGPGNGVHILSVGADESIAHWFLPDKNAYNEMVKAEQEKLNDKAIPNLSWQQAASHVLWDRIRAHGGLAVYCHPYWFTHDRQYIPKVLSDSLIDEQYFDVLEIVNGGSSELGIIHYHEMVSKGRKIPILSSTDAHNAAALVNSFNLVLSESVALKDLQANIMKLNNVAVQYIPKAKKYYVHGPFRLTRFAYFLLENFYPAKHDPMCEEEGDWLLTLARTKTGEYTDQAACDKAMESLKASRGRVPALFEKYWQK